MPKYYLLEPEIAGELGPDTVMDPSVHPPRVSDLHYDLKGWLGDDLLESFPCYIVTDRCRDALENGGFSGCTFAPVRVTASDVFLELYPGRAVPTFHWLKVDGIAGEDDLGVADDHRLVVSGDVLKVLRSLSIDHCDFEELQ